MTVYNNQSSSFTTYKLCYEDIRFTLPASDQVPAQDRPLVSRIDKEVTSELQDKIKEQISTGRPLSKLVLSMGTRESGEPRKDKIIVLKEGNYIRAPRFSTFCEVAQRNFKLKLPGNYKPEFTYLDSDNDPVSIESDKDIALMLLSLSKPQTHYRINVKALPEIIELPSTPQKSNLFSPIPVKQEKWMPLQRLTPTYESKTQNASRPIVYPIISPNPTLKVESPALEVDSPLSSTFLKIASYVPSVICGNPFEGKLTFENNGDLTWPNEFHLIFVGSSTLHQKDDMVSDKLWYHMMPENELKEIKKLWTRKISLRYGGVTPRQKFTFKIKLIAPQKPGQYTGAWQLADDKCNRFGAIGLVQINAIPSEAKFDTIQE